MEHKDSPTDPNLEEVMRQAETLLKKRQEYPLTEKATEIKNRVSGVIMTAGAITAAVAARLLLAPADYAYTLQEKGYRDNADAVRSQAVLIPICVLIGSLVQESGFSNALIYTALATTTQGVSALVLEEVVKNHNLEENFPPA